MRDRPERYYSEHRVFIDSLRAFLNQEILPHLTAWEESDRFPDTVFQALGAQGYLGILLPEAYGGIDGDLRLAAAWCEVFGEVPAVGFTTGVNMHSLVISNALNRFGTKESKDEWLPRAVTGDAIGAYAFTEPGAGSDLASLKTRAVRDGNDWVLNGAKTFITNGDRADFILVLARTDPAAGYKGFTTFVVDTATKGFTVTRTLDKLGWRSSDTAELHFEDLRVPQHAVLGNVGEGWVQAAGSLNWERLMLTLTSLGGARRCFLDTVRYARDRAAFGKPIIEIPAVSDFLQQSYRRLLNGEALSHRALEKMLTGDQARLEVSLAKRQVCEDAVWIADRCIQIHGGYGYTKEFSPERWWRDLRLMTIGGGTSEIMGNIAAKELGLL